MDWIDWIFIMFFYIIIFRAKIDHNSCDICHLASHQTLNHPASHQTLNCESQNIWWGAKWYISYEHWLIWTITIKYEYSLTIDLNLPLDKDAIQIIYISICLCCLYLTTTISHRLLTSIIVDTSFSWLCEPQRCCFFRMFEVVVDEEIVRMKAYSSAGN